MSWLRAHAERHVGERIQVNHSLNTSAIPLISPVKGSGRGGDVSAALRETFMPDSESVLITSLQIQVLFTKTLYKSIKVPIKIKIKISITVCLTLVT